MHHFSLGRYYLLSHPTLLPQFAGKVAPADRVANVFRTQTLTSPHPDVLVEILAPSKWQDMDSHYHSINPVPALQDEYPFKRRRLANDPNSSWLEEVLFDASALMKVRQFWKSLWQDKEDFFREVSVCRVPNPIEGVMFP